MSFNTDALYYNKSILDQLCSFSKPLSDLNISTFGYINFLGSGEIFHISNNHIWFSEYIKNFLFNDSERYVNEIQDVISKGFKYFLRFPNCNQNFSRVMLDCGLCYGICLYQKKDDGFELFAFSADNNYPLMTDFYINNFDFLRRYIVYFKNKIHLDCNHVHKKLITPNPKLKWYKKEFFPEKDTFLKNTTMKCFCEKDKRLSLREAENAYYRFLGYSIKERASIMKVSPRTIDSYTYSSMQKHPLIFSKKNNSSIKEDIINYFNIEKRGTK